MQRIGNKGDRKAEKSNRKLNNPKISNSKKAPPLFSVRREGAGSGSGVQGQGHMVKPESWRVFPMGAKTMEEVQLLLEMPLEVKRGRVEVLDSPFLPPYISFQNLPLARAM